MASHLLDGGQPDVDNTCATERCAVNRIALDLLKGTEVQNVILSPEGYASSECVVIDRDDRLGIDDRQTLTVLEGVVPDGGRGSEVDALK